MLVTGQQVSGFPVQAVIGDLLLEAERADLCGLVGKKKGAVKISLKPRSLNRIVVEGYFRFEILSEAGAPRRNFDDGKVFEVLKWGREPM
ncbi:hypothetical protein KSB_93130 [Ktedonobacter robiniae]|uniref:Uncharacterized protein n=1 Tax=Ktedonobacter robiniae TaxID=2778365 RepID=A0ABQ3V797_9CHLR|nr:hypothetical protein KSB_66860 [Ktedonobacter robiniae]GHO60838.1 hypothetical protein KSB_93130 [Ktedonobacter robiniae]